MKKYKNHFFIILSLILLITTISQLSSKLSITTAPKSIVYASSNDAGRAIQTSILTRWYNSNHFGPYGNLYFRFAHTIAKLSPEAYSPSLTAEENNELNHHFALLLTSLLALAAFCFFLAYILLEDLSLSLLAGILLLNISLIDSTWVFLLFTAHPDHLLMLSIAIGSFFTIKYTQTKSQRNFILAAIFWGIATAVKRSTVIFVFSFLYLFLSQGFNKQSLVKGLKFLGYMLLAYLVVGFPQNFGFYKHVKFMLHESQNSRSPTIESILEYIGLISNQVKYLFLALIPLHLIFGKRILFVPKQFIVFLFLGLVMTLSTRMVTPHLHHPMPLVAALLVTFIFLLKNLPVLNFKYKFTTFFIVIIVSLYFLRGPSAAFTSQVDRQLTCRPEAFKLLNMIKLEQKDGKSFLGREPYFPFDSSKPDLSHQYWGASAEDLDSHNATLFGTQVSFGKQFLEDVPIYNMSDKALNWTDKKKLYQQVLTSDQFVTPKGYSFKKIYEDNCGFMLWKR